MASMKKCFEDSCGTHICTIDDEIFVDGKILECDKIRYLKDGGTREYHFNDCIFTRGQTMFKPHDKNTLVKYCKEHIFEKSETKCDIKSTKSTPEERLQKFNNLKKNLKNSGVGFVYEDSDTFYVKLD